MTSQILANVFRSKLEDILPANEINIDAGKTFGKYRQYFSNAALRHPAKIAPNFAEYLIQKYSVPECEILDPFAGVFTIPVIAAANGRKGVGIELEHQYCQWSLESTGYFPIGYLKIIEGDARDQSNYRNLYSLSITSPPYANSALSGGDPEKRRLRMIAAGHDPKDFLGGNARSATLKHYGGTDRLSGQNIARLKGDKYWEAVGTVYTRVFAALQQGGRLIVVIKPIQKKGEVLDLPLKTWQILEKVGFQLEAVEKFYIKILNTWRNIAYRRNSHLVRIRHEYVIVVRKNFGEMNTRLIAVDAKDSLRHGGRGIQVPRKCSFTEEDCPCGCVRIHWSDSVLEVRGCERKLGEHRSRVVVVCRVKDCGEEFAHWNQYKKHQWKHAV